LTSIVARGSGWNVLGQLAQPLIAILLTPFIIHGVGLPRYGLYAITMALVALLSAADGGIGLSAQRFFAVYARRDHGVAPYIDTAPGRDWSPPRCGALRRGATDRIRL
jgi:O-antigen/teichoic acid export membrane protein